MEKEIKSYENEKVYDEDQLLMDEFYYQIYNGQKPHISWVSGLVKVYDYSDKSGDYDFESSLEYMDDDQELLFAIINNVVSKKSANLEILAIFTNPIKNEDGSNYLLKQVLVVYGFGTGNTIVIRVPFYGLTEYAKTKYIQKIAEQADGVK